MFLLTIYQTYSKEYRRSVCSNYLSFFHNASVLKSLSESQLSYSVQSAEPWSTRNQGQCIIPDSMIQVKIETGYFICGHNFRVV